MAESRAAGAVGRLDPLPGRVRLLVGQIAGLDGRVDRGERRRLAGGDDPVAIGPELRAERVEERVAVLGAVVATSVVVSSVASAEPISVPPTIADRMSAPANPRLLVSRIEMVLAVVGDEWVPGRLAPGR